MVDLKHIESNVEVMDIFDLLGNLKTLAIIEYEEELKYNPRAHSAKLRVAEKL